MPHKAKSLIVAQRAYVAAIVEIRAGVGMTHDPRLIADTLGLVASMILDAATLFEPDRDALEALLENESEERRQLLLDTRARLHEIL